MLTPIWRIDFWFNDKWGERHRWQKLPGADMKAAHDLAEALCKMNGWKMISLTPFGSMDLEQIDMTQRNGALVPETQPGATRVADGPAHAPTAFQSPAPPPPPAEEPGRAHRGEDPVYPTNENGGAPKARRTKKGSSRREYGTGVPTQCPFCAKVERKSKMVLHVNGHRIGAMGGGDMEMAKKCKEWIEANMSEKWKKAKDRIRQEALNQ